MILQAIGELIGIVVMFIFEVTMWMIVAVVELFVSIWDRRAFSWPHFKNRNNDKTKDKNVEPK